MGTNFTNEKSPIIGQVSFFKVFESLEKIAKSKDKHRAMFASNLLAELEPYQELREGFTDLSLIDKYKDQIDKLSSLLFPEALLKNEIKAVVPPFFFEPLYTSERFGNILKAAGPDFSIEMKDIDEDRLHIIASTAILNGYFNMPVDMSRPYILEIPNMNTGKVRYYRMAFNVDLMEPFPTDKAVQITKEDYHQLIDNYDDIDLWKEKFPEQSWIMKGIGIINLMDVTMDYSIASISNSLVVKSADTLEKVRENLRSLFGIYDLEVGFVACNNDSFYQIHNSEENSLLLGHKMTESCDMSLCPNNYELLINQKKPLAISDVKDYYERSGASVAKNLMDQGFGSYIIMPLEYEGEVQGYIEIGSKKPYLLNSSSFNKIHDVIPIMAMAAARFQNDHNNAIEAVIQQECTTIHDSVKWKFEEEAEKYLTAVENESNPVFKDIVFKDIYPLYGQMDIKGSSSRRNKAVIGDLVTQLKEVRKILNAAKKKKDMPFYEELVYRVEKYIEDLNGGLLAGSENSILSFLKTEIYPVFDFIKKNDRDLANKIAKYDEKLNSDNGVIYEERRDFDESVMQINHGLASFIDEKQSEAQNMFPHYFERYKTDGLEYNMYIGEAITRESNFDPLYLKNLRLWQMITMCEMENHFIKIKEDLKVKLEVASLILVYSTPLSIHFRMDEKKFDVEGAYNARYEIVKKRVDKAHIKGTDERITQPGKITIIYSNDQDKLEYQKYIEFLVEKGYLKANSLEDHRLEDLQGITGLKALRVEVNYTNTSDEAVTYEELIKSI